MSGRTAFCVSGRAVFSVSGRAAFSVSSTETEVAEPVLDEPLLDEPLPDEDVLTDKPWIVIVWNDPVNLMSYVVYVFQKLFGYSRQKATKLMLDVHHKGKAIVSHGNREKAETDVARLHAHGLWATMERDTPA